MELGCKHIVIVNMLRAGRRKCCIVQAAENKLFVASVVSMRSVVATGWVVHAKAAVDFGEEGVGGHS